MTYTEKVMQITKSALDQYEALETEKRELKTQYDREEISGNAYQERLDDLTTRRTALHIEASVALDQARAGYQAAIEKTYEVDVSMPHDNAKLLQIPGLILTPEQFTSMAP